MGFVILVIRNSMMSKLTIVNIKTNPMQHWVYADPVINNRKKFKVREHGTVSIQIKPIMHMVCAELVPAN